MQIIEWDLTARSDCFVVNDVYESISENVRPMRESHALKKVIENTSQKNMSNLLMGNFSHLWMFICIIL